MLKGVGGEDEDGQGDRDPHQELGELRQSFLEARHWWRLVERGRDASEGGILACGHHDSGSRSGLDHGAHQRAARQVSQPRLAADGRGALAGRNRLTGDRGFIAGQIDGLDQPQVGRDDMSEADPDDVATYDVGDVHFLLGTIADDHGVVGDPVLERVGCALRLVLVPEPHADAHAEDDQDDRRVRNIAGGHRQDRSHGEQHQQGTLHLSPQDMSGRCPVGRNSVRALAGQALGGFLAGKPGVRGAKVGLQLSDIDAAGFLDQRGGAGRDCRSAQRLRVHTRDASPSTLVQGRTGANDEVGDTSERSLKNS